ncbi:histidine utilization repressor [Aureimonas sp. D3]|uniref:histidine utilization repressor n=1 Tax=Aureimonas sp. D3 TaxID=1638164 RepID=UPI000B207157|nr:histidine utilization repressor [Aureimonas sp. D3]
MASVTVAPRPSLHQTILAELRGRILSGEWPPGTQLPFEQALAAQFGCSRMTVNKVMGELVSAGLIERRRKAGSFVRRPQSYSAVMEIADIRREVEGLGLAYGFEMMRLEQREADAQDAKRLGLGEPRPVLSILCRHFAARQPFCLENRLIDLTVVPDAAETAFSAAEPPGAWLMARVPWTSAEHTIRAAGADALTSAALLIPPGTPCLVIDRRTWNSDASVTAVEITYPGEAHELVARFTPSPGA